MASEIIVNPDEDNNGCTVFVTTNSRVRLDTLTPYNEVRIITANGVAAMTDKQFQLMAQIARDLRMTNGNSSND